MNTNVKESKSESFIRGFGLLIVLSLLLICFSIILSNTECYQPGHSSLCGLSGLILILFVAFPLVCVGIVGVVISAIIQKIKKPLLKFTSEQKRYIVLSLFIGVCIILLFGSSSWFNVDLLYKLGF
jgi:hypothetical protein